MGKIIILDELTANQIAAGEVVERPASVVKELCENSIDAGATQIHVEIRGGGIKYIRIVDDGSGIENDDVSLVFERHSTSKLRSGADLDKGILTRGFRGEALASISAVAEVNLVTKTKDDVQGSRITIRGGDVTDYGTCGANKGTIITVTDLFYNTPARYKFLKKDSSESALVADVLSKLALSAPDIAFTLNISGEQSFKTVGNGNLRDAVYSIYGKNTAENITAVDYSENGITVSGFAGNVNLVRGNRSNQVFFINGRLFKSKTVTTALELGYGTMLMKGRYPFAVLNIQVNPEAVDVNVHPQKAEVRFSDESKVGDAVRHAIRNALNDIHTIPDIPIYEKSAVSTVSTVKPVYEPRKTVYEDKQTHEYIPRTEKQADTSIIENPAMYEKNETFIEQKLNEKVSDYDIYDEHKSFNSEIAGMEYKGSLFGTYLIFQNDKDAFFIDQHAAHERIRYERLKENFNTGKIEVQNLLFPVTVVMSPAEYRNIFSYKDKIQKLGIEYEDFGSNTVIIRTIPVEMETGNIESVFRYMADQLKDGADLKLKADAILYKMACTGAVKGNTPLHKEQIDALVEQLAKVENPYNCPHGRPTVVKISGTEIEKWFKRIV